jgi:hypothetical protein
MSLWTECYNDASLTYPDEPDYTHFFPFKGTDKKVTREEHAEFLGSWPVHTDEQAILIFVNSQRF